MMEEKRMEYRWPKTMSGEEAKLLFGGDYNPDQWPEAVWEEDVRLMKKAKVNVVTVAVFAWANLEPEDGIYTFEWLDRVLDKLYEGGISVDLATATATPPRWLTSAHPEILPRNKQGEVLWPGSRQQWRSTSADMRSALRKRWQNAIGIIRRWYPGMYRMNLAATTVLTIQMTRHLDSRSG